MSAQRASEAGGAFDVVILGSGVAGLGAAACAHAAGLSAVLLEKSSKLGGGSAFSYGLIWAPRSHLAEAAGYVDSRDAVMRYMRHLAGGFADSRRLDVFVDTIPPVMRHLEELGLPLQIIHGITDHYYGIAEGARRKAA